MNKFIQTILGYKRALLPILYGPLYLLVFFYLEQRPTDHFHLIEMPIDKLIPFCEFFVIPYYMWFAYVAVTVTCFLFLDKTDYYKLCIVLGIGMTLFLIISYIYPNGLMLRPDSFARDNFCVDLVKALYKTDTSTNVFPSIHCFNSMACNAAFWHNRTMKKYIWIRIASLVLSTSIILSTLFIKQHSVFDFLTALGLFIIIYIPIYILPLMRKHQEAVN